MMLTLGQCLHHCVKLHAFFCTFVGFATLPHELVGRINRCFKLTSTLPVRNYATKITVEGYSPMSVCLLVI